jgi:hypothetical protein
MVKKNKKKETTEQENINYSLNEFDYDGPVKEEEYVEDEQNIEIDYDAGEVEYEDD